MARKATPRKGRKAKQSFNAFGVGRAGVLAPITKLLRANAEKEARALGGNVVPVRVTIQER